MKLCFWLLYVPAYIFFFMIGKAYGMSILPDALLTARGRKKAAKSTKLVATPLLFVCISLRFQSLCERSIQYFSGLRKYFFPIFSFSETCTNCIQYSYMLLFTFPYGVSCNDFLTEFSHFFR